MHTELGELKKVPLREVWALEPTHFSVWLANNLDKLGHALGLELSAPQREMGVGSFSTDIVAQDLSRGRKVIIENQLERTNHDHLGKLITYASGLDASVVIWISPEFREEHRSALDWLNTNTVEACEFFGIQIEAWSIDQSRAAPVFKIVASPNGWQKRISGELKRDAQESKSSQFFVDFFTRLAEEMRAAGFQRVGQPSGNAWLVVERWQNMHLAISFSRSKLLLGLYIDWADRDVNQKIFDSLRLHQSEIEERLALPLSWDFNDDRRRQNILTYIDSVDRLDEQALADARRWGVESAKQFQVVFKPFVDVALRELSETAITS